MTAKEIAKEIKNDIIWYEYDSTEQSLIDLIIKFAKAKCKEQREICGKIAENGQIDERLIYNAPEPNYD